jgi:hypothetical protein
MNWKPIETLNKSDMQFVIVTDGDLVRLQLWNPYSRIWETGLQDPQRWKNPDIAEPTKWMECPDAA